jgi:acetoin utilization deacetylase AcuC-like enzyme
MCIPLLYPASHRGHDPELEFADGSLRTFVECPQRVDLIRDGLLATGLVADGGPVGSISMEEILETHDERLVACLEMASRGMTEAGDYVYAGVFAVRPEMARVAGNPVHPLGYYCFDSDTPIGRATWQAALSSAGTAAAAAALIVEEGARCAYALCRPPGHHAGTDFFGGYCYLNNAAIAVKRLLQQGRVVIIDIDYHHGNGSQAIFWDEARVFVGSLHGDPDFAFPFYSGYADEIGGPEAVGTNLNVPLPAGTDGAAYLIALDRMLDRVSAFDPATLVISTGYDAYAGDPLSTFEVEADAYGHIGGRLAQLDLPTLFVQEGGYCLEALATLAQNLISGFLSGG